MASEEDDQRRSTEPEEKEDSSSSGSGNEDSGDEEVLSVEWLATHREKRSTAGNRMKSMLAAEEPDDELELLFTEDGEEEDAGFEDVEEDASDVQMDSSSSDDEDTQDNGDELEGEKELERQARESRRMARKRKAQEAIPLKFRKKAKISTGATGPSATVPKPRPKKKSERASWLPSPADMPTRASKRETTMLSKEQLHQQMIEREMKRLKQVEAMERKAKKMEALKKPPMTQAEHLAEAAIVEKRNSKSLNRWEEAEKQREEERRAKLAALNNRHLSGPVVTFWSGVGEWVDGRLRHLGKTVTIEDKPAKKKRVSIMGPEEPTEPPKPTKPAEPTEPRGKELNDAEKLAKEPAADASSDIKSAGDVQTSKKQAVESSENKPAQAPQTSTEEEEPPQASQAAEISASQAVHDTEAPDPIPSPAPQKQEGPTMAPVVSQPDDIRQLSASPQRQAPETRTPELKPPEMKPPDMRPPDTSLYTTSMFAPPAQAPVMRAPELKPPTNSFLAPPPGATGSGLSMPVLGYSPASSKSAVLAPPNTAQRQSPLSMPRISPPLQPESVGTPPRTTHTPPTVPPSRTPSKPLSNLKPTHINAAKKHAHATPRSPSPPPPPPNGKSTRNCIVLQNFNENAIKDKSVQTRILFGKEMSKLGKHAHPPRCVITNLPARYRDPKTGLPYHDARAYKEIQNLQHGDYKWSSLVGAWVGAGSFAARGVPARFLDPNAPPPPKPTEVKEVKDATPPSTVKQEGSDQGRPSSLAMPSGSSAAQVMPTKTGTPSLAAPPAAIVSSAAPGALGSAQNPASAPTTAATTAMPAPASASAPAPMPTVMTPAGTPPTASSTAVTPTGAMQTTNTTNTTPALPATTSGPA